MRMCDLELRLEGTTLQRRVDRLHDELARAGLVFKPYVWLATDWFTPEGTTGFAVPFYLAHRRLVRLEHAQMFEAEGSSHDWCMKLLRHEAAHAFDNAYRLHRRDDWRRTFGRYSAPYRTASSAASSDAWPVISTMSQSGWSCESCWSTSKPLVSPILTSLKTRLKRVCAASSSAVSPS